MDKSHLYSKKKSSVVLILLVISVILTYLLLHELGHLFAATLFGVTIYDFNLHLLSAHISFDRYNLTNFQNSIVDVSGTVFPLLLSFSAFCVSGKRSLFPFISLLLFISSLFGLIPHFIPMGNSDTLNLMRYAGVNQTTVSMIFGLLFISGIFFLLQKKSRMRVASLYDSFFVKYCSLDTPKYAKLIIAIGFYIVAFLAVGDLSFLNNRPGDNYEKIEASKLSNSIIYPFVVARIICSGRDTLIVQARNLVADSVKVAYIVSAEDEEHVILNGNGVTLRGDRLFNFVPKEGEIRLTVDGMNIRGELMVFKNK